MAVVLTEPSERTRTPTVNRPEKPNALNGEVVEGLVLMTFTQKKIYYFETPGETNTPDAARFAIERAKELGINTIVVASTSGKTASVLFDAIRGTSINLVIVTHVIGFTKPGEWEFSQ